MAVPSAMKDLSTTASSNSPAGSENPISTDDFHRAIQAILRHTNAKGSDIASASSIDLGAATGEFVDVTGTTTITALGTIVAGIVRTVRFTDALTLTHNGTSLILPTSANITTANGDVAIFRSLGSGNWKCVSYIKQDGTALSAPYLATAGGTMTGNITMSSAMDKWAKGADVASATALPLLTDGNYFDVTGTTTITSFNSVGVGSVVKLHFDGALILTHHATDLILPSAANITTVAGDEAEFVEYASGDWRCVNYQRASGQALVASTSNTIGVGQTWQDLTASRARNVEYTNSTGKPIMVVFSCTGAGSNKFMLVDTVEVGQACNDTSSSSTTVIVPNGSTYKLDSTTAANIRWSELR